MLRSLTKKLIALMLFTTALMPALHSANLQPEYCYLSMLIHNANAAAFKKELAQLAASPKAKTPEFREMLTTLARDVEHALLNTHAMRGADISGNIADNGMSQCKWGIGELALAGVMFKFYPEKTQENARIYWGMLATGIGSSILGIVSLKNGVIEYFFARRYGKHIQQTIEALETIKKEIITQLECVTK